MESYRSDGFTCWSLIEGAAAGDERHRSEFSHRYLPMLRTCFERRWRGSPLRSLVDDAVQEVFLACLREGGVLAKAANGPTKKFRALLHGTAKNIALRVERRWSREQGRREPGSFWPDEHSSDDETFSKQFDRAWALSLIHRAAELQRSRAQADDEAARGRVELLRLRFEEGLSIREIAERWQEKVGDLHWVYRRARTEYESCLREVVAFHNPGAAKELEGEYQRLLQLIE